MRFLKEVNVDIAPTLMTFGVSRDHGRFEWSGTGPGIFAQRSNIFKARMWRMIFDIIRFNQFALDLLAQKDKHQRQQGHQSIGDYLDQEGYSQAFRDDYLIPMTAAVWSTSPDKASLDFPALTLVRFMWNHHLLTTLAERPTWLTIPGGSQRYIDAILKSSDPGRFHFHTSTPVTGISRTETSSPQISFKAPESSGEQTQTFDHIIMACHGDEILPILSAKQTVLKVERDILSAFETTENVAYLHSDLSLMPQRRPVWTAWNYLTESTPSKLAHPAGVTLTYWMNLLQHLPEEKYGPILVTLNPGHEPDPQLTQAKFTYRHPLYNSAAVDAQGQLEQIQNTSGISYCGAWTKYGFHEDGFSSGVKVAIDHLGAKLPFEFVDSTFSRGQAPDLDWRDRLLRAFILVIQRVIVMIELLLLLPPIAFVLSLGHGNLQSGSRRKGD